MFLLHPSLRPTNLVLCFLVVSHHSCGRVGILTQDGSVAASITGQCAYNGENYENPVIPGSNLYVFTWLCLVSSVEIALGWKATQAMSFAQAAKGDATGRNGGNSVGDDEDDDEDGEL